VNSAKQRLKEHLNFLYDEDDAKWLFGEVKSKIESFRERNPSRAEKADRDSYFSEEDTVLITYGDQVKTPDEAPLRTLGKFLKKTVEDEFSTVHLLPFFPYSSDDGFSITNYRTVNPDMGDWDDIQQLDENFNLMFDAVINHVSRQGKWFQRYLEGDPAYEDFFIEVDESWDLSQVVRPRDNPLITEIEGEEGTKKLWTTFSDDQIDLNYANPDVLAEIIDLLLFYVEQGAEIIRLDAIAYLWKKSGTTCIHLEETHRVVQIFRKVLDLAAPDVALITETNVPHEQNVSYFGDGENEAQMVYQFPLPPLVLDAFVRSNTKSLTAWAKGLEFPDTGATFFNFLASHDGIGVRPAEGLLPESSIERMVERTREHGGAVSYKSDSDGGKSPYELNITYFDALSDPNGNEPKELQVSRFMSSQAIMLAFRGVPGVYVHSLFGSRNWVEGMEKTGRKRTINREKFSLEEIEKELEDPNSIRSMVLNRFKELLQIRQDHAAFSPASEQRVLDLGSIVFAFSRIPENKKSSVLCIHSVSENEQTLSLPSEVPNEGEKMEDLISGRTYELPEIRVPPYEVLWLEKVSGK